MGIAKRMLAAGGALGLLLGTAIGTSATTPAPNFVLTAACVSPGGSQTITVNNEAAGTAIAILTSTGGGSLTAKVPAAGTLVDTYTVSATAHAGAVAVHVIAFTSEGVQLSDGAFTVATTAIPCPNPSAQTEFGLMTPEIQQVQDSVKKTCAAGVTGNAVFSMTLTVQDPTTDQNTTINFPTTISAACNGAAVTLPKVPVGVKFKLHESTLPANAVAATDTTIVVQAVSTTTINNVKTPTPILAVTGGGTATPGLAWPGILLGLLLVIAGAGLIRRRVS